MRIDESNFHNLRWMVARLIPHLEWRHSGLGALQAYVREGDVDELRVHLWHDSLMAPGIDLNGSVHDHRFNLDSTVLLGDLSHVEHEPVPDPAGEWRIHDVVHARLAQSITGGHHLVGDEDPRRYSTTTSVAIFAEGTRYWFPARHFHQTVFHPSGTVTLVRKTDQRASPPARVMYRADSPLVHAFESPLPESSWRHLLDDFARRLQ